MSAYKFPIIFIAIISVALLFVFVIRANWYPIAIVNNHLISAARFTKNYEAAKTYYRNALKTYMATSSPDSVLAANNSAIEADTLNQLIEASLVGDEVSKELGSDEQALVAAKIGKYETDAAFHRAAEALYGMPFSDFKTEVLVPQAEKDILSGRLFLKGKTFDAWLTSAKQSARIAIFSSAFHWDGEAVAKRQ